MKRGADLTPHPLPQTGEGERFAEGPGFGTGNEHPIRTALRLAVRAAGDAEGVDHRASRTPPAGSGADVRAAVGDLDEEGLASAA